MSVSTPGVLTPLEERLRWSSERWEPETEAGAADDPGISGKESVLPLPGPNILVLSEEKSLLIMLYTSDTLVHELYTTNGTREGGINIAAFQEEELRIRVISRRLPIVWRIFCYSF
jgi:hypothetical protein